VSKVIARKAADLLGTVGKKRRMLLRLRCPESHSGTDGAGADAFLASLDKLFAWKAMWIPGGLERILGNQGGGFLGGLASLLGNLTGKSGGLLK